MTNEVEDLRKQLIGVQEMLALVLKQVGQPVVVTGKTIREGLPAGVGISVEQDIENDCFIFSLENHADGVPQEPSGQDS